jgi:disulfide oxidoreductase YuzD
MEKTAVEWLEMQMASKIADASIRISAVKFYDLINQAKEMEKQQIIDAYEKGKYSFGKDAEKYYNETYKQQP